MHARVVLNMQHALRLDVDNARVMFWHACVPATRSGQSKAVHGWGLWKMAVMLRFCDGVIERRCLIGCVGWLFFVCLVWMIGWADLLAGWSSLHLPSWKWNLYELRFHFKWCNCKSWNITCWWFWDVSVHDAEVMPCIYIIDWLLRATCLLFHLAVHCDPFLRLAFLTSLMAVVFNLVYVCICIEGK